MSDRRGKKINPAKNAGAARDFATAKKVGRPKQIFDPVTKTWSKAPEVTVNG